MSYELPIIKIIKKGISYDSNNTYKLGEVVEVHENISEELLKENSAVKATKAELEKWEVYLTQENVKKAHKAERHKELQTVKIKIDNYIDNANYFYEYQPFFYDDVGIFWFWNDEGSRYEQMDDVDVMNKLDDTLGLEGQTVNSGIKYNYLEAFKRVGRKHKPQDAPVKWIQFKNKAYSINSGLMYSVTPDYFFTNPIPYSFGKSSETPIMDKLFEEWVGKTNITLMYEIIAYCCYRGYPMQVLFSLVGNGRNGKSCFLRLLSRFIGQENLCSTELDLLVGRNSSRFESFKLYKKLICLMGETNFGTLNNSSLLKKLTGGDMIGFEMKNKKPFDDYNYAKMLIASNSLPSSEDTSEGFYRRWVIIEFPNQFPEGKDILDTIPEQEYANLVNKVTQILPNLLKKGSFTNQGSIKERTMKYILSSNPLSIFIEKACIKDENEFVSYGKLYTAYVKFLKDNKKRKVKMKEFKSALEDEGFWVERTSKRNEDDSFKNGNWINGLDLKTNYESYVKKQENVPQQIIHIEEVQNAT